MSEGKGDCMLFADELSVIMWRRNRSPSPMTQNQVRVRGAAEAILHGNEPEQDGAHLRIAMPSGGFLGVNDQIVAEARELVEEVRRVHARRQEPYPGWIIAAALPTRLRQCIREAYSLEEIPSMSLEDVRAAGRSFWMHRPNLGKISVQQLASAVGGWP